MHDLTQRQVEILKSLIEEYGGALGAEQIEKIYQRICKSYSDASIRKFIPVVVLRLARNEIKTLLYNQDDKKPDT